MARRNRGKGTGSLFKRSPNGPWIALYFAVNGKRVQHSTRTTDLTAAERILSKINADIALRRDMVIDPKTDRFSTEGRKLITDQINLYLAQCRRSELDAEHIASKQRHLNALVELTKINQLYELQAETLERYLFAIKTSKKSARTINFARQLVVAFANWCVETGKIEVNPLSIVRKQDESRDRRRRRRPLTDDELGRLLNVAQERRRESFYLAAALAGLRRGDFKSITWGDVNFNEGTLTIRLGKARRVDTIPMHPQLAAALQADKTAQARQVGKPMPATANVWPELPTNLTRQKDFLRAGIIQQVPVMDDAGNEVKIGKGKRLRTAMRLVTTDQDGLVADLHALRTTLGTMMARNGVAPQIAQKIMRHSNYKTTLQSYTVLGLSDTSAAMSKVAAITAKPAVLAVVLAATGTTDAAAGASNCQLYCQQLGRETGNNDAQRRVDRAQRSTRQAHHKPLVFKAFPANPKRKTEVEQRGLEPLTPSLQS